MKVTYRRELKHNYMILEPETKGICQYERRMLEANRIEGLLRFQLRPFDGEPRFYYEITSKQPLSGVLDGRMITYSQIRNLVLGIAGTLSRMELYLLPESSILLEPDYIYVEPESFRIWLCPVPGLERDFPEAYGKLLEYLLGKVDHQDKDCVVLAYGLYQESRKENYGIQDMLRLLGTGTECRQEQEAEPAERREREPGGTAAPRNQRPPARGTRREERRTTENGRKQKPAGLWGRLRDWWQERFGPQKEISGQVPWEMLFTEEDPPAAPGPRPDMGIQGARSSGTFRQELPQEQEPLGYRRQTDPGESLHTGPDTVLLADLAQEQGERLRRLRALSPDQEDIVLSYYPFIIGKQENLADHILDKETVSRLHLRIDREGERYFARDLNSTNGTTIAGRLLDNNETAELHPGDEVWIARYGYRFE
ncbi:MAG TPA: FHA domain-containing protein [Candidatus Ventrimonas merdavium]|nr:FHA domain-containing protein [Candidatus Ventrimonas merdavium]